MNIYGNQNPVIEKRLQRAIGILLGIIVLIAIIWYSRIESRIGASTLVFTSLTPDHVIFIDGVKRKAVTNDTESVTIQVSSGEHTITVSKDAGDASLDFWPWQKEITIKEKEIVTFSPFTLSQTMSGMIIGEKNTEYAQIVELFEQLVTPSVDNKKLSLKQDTNIWIQGNSIIAEWVGEEADRPASYCASGRCSSLITVFTSEKSLERSTLAFYKDRSDVILFSLDTGVFAIEIDKRSTQNFQPVYVGTAPELLRTSDGRYYVLDNGNLLLIEL